MVKIIRWICKKCNKKWLYPIEKCVYCKDNVEKQIGTKTKVVGISKVFIPSPYHPIVPYYVLILEDEHGNRMPKKTMKEYKIGDIYEDKPTNNEHAVSIIKIKYDVYEAVKEAIELIGNIKINSKSKILIKPKIIARAYPYTAMNTNPKVIDAIISILLEKGAKKENITVGEHSLFVPMETALPRSEIGKVCEKHAVKFVDLALQGFEKKKIEEFEFEISKEFFNKDLIINAPVLKTDMLLGIAASLENMISSVSKETFIKLKKAPEKALKAIVLLNKTLPKYLTIADGTIGMQSNAPEYGEPAFLNLIMASRDPVALDKSFQELGLLRKAEYIELAGKLEIGETNPNKIPIVGDELKALQKEIKPATGSKLIKMNKDAKSKNR